MELDQVSRKFWDFLTMCNSILFSKNSWIFSAIFTPIIPNIYKFDLKMLKFDPYCGLHVFFFNDIGCKMWKKRRFSFGLRFVYIDRIAKSSEVNPACKQRNGACMQWPAGWLQLTTCRETNIANERVGVWLYIWILFVKNVYWNLSNKLTRREVNKNNLLGGWFLIFLPKNPEK